MTKPTLTLSAARTYALAYVREPSWTIARLRASIANAQRFGGYGDYPVNCRARVAHRWELAFLRRALNMRRQMVGARTLP